jgi:hypothetical protein
VTTEFKPPIVKQEGLGTFEKKVEVEEALPVAESDKSVGQKIKEVFSDIKHAVVGDKDKDVQRESR